MLVGPPTAAASADQPDGPEGQHDKPSLRVDVSVENVRRADGKGRLASLAMTEYSARLTWHFLLLDAAHLEVDRGTGGGRDGAAEYDSPGSLTRMAPGVQFAGALSDLWGLWIKMTAIAGFESRMSSGGWTYNPQLVGLHTPGSRWTLYAGAGMLWHPVDATFYPVFGAAWNTDSRTGASGALGFPETMLRYGFHDRLAVKADFEWHIRMYLLADDNPSAPSGYLRTEELKPGIHLQYAPTESLQVTAGIRRHLRRRQTYFDRSRRELDDDGIEDAWSSLLNVECRF